MAYHGTDPQNIKNIQKLPFKIIRVVLCRKVLKNTLNIRKMTRIFPNYWNISSNISLNGSIIDQVKSHKLLGIQLDQNLNFDIKTEVLCKSLLKKIGFLKHISQFLKRSHKIIYYDAVLNLLFSMVRVCGHLRARQIWTAFLDFKRGQQE